MGRTSDEPAGRPGRPRAFCPEAALDAALGVFWRHGYEGASLADLTAAMGINRPSLYAAFGNKEHLFGLAVDRYAARAGAGLAAALAEPTARAGVERVLREAVDAVAGRGGPGGCFLTVAALACGPASGAVRDAVAARRRSATEPPVRARLARAVAAGELPADAPVAAMAAYVATVAQGLSVQAAGGAGRAELHAVIDVALRAWPARPPRPRPGKTAGRRPRPGG